MCFIKSSTDKTPFILLQKKQQGDMLDSTYLEILLSITARLKHPQDLALPEPNLDKLTCVTLPHLHKQSTHLKLDFEDFLTL